MVSPPDEETFREDDGRWQRHEILLSTLGLAVTLALAVRAGPLSTTTVVTAMATAAYGLVITATRFHRHALLQKFRFAAAYLFVLWFYKAIEIIVPALLIPTHDASLLKADSLLFGVTPAVPVQAWTSTGLNELMSGCYLTYLVYLHVCVVHSWLMPLELTRQFANWVYSVYVVGLAGYLLYPAIGPENAFAELFGPDLQGPLLTPLNRTIVQSGSSVYDAFPSLHVLITCTLLEFDRQHVRRRFYWMILPAIGILASTIYLRYHYAIDLIAGGLLFMGAKICFNDGGDGHVETGNAG